MFQSAERLNRIFTTATIDHKSVDSLTRSGALYKPDPMKNLTPENLYYLSVLDAHSFFGIPLSQNINTENLTTVLGTGWRSKPLTENTMTEPFETMAETIARVKDKDFGRRIIVDDETSYHPEDRDFSDTTALKENFFYIHGEGLHMRRLAMLSGLAVYGIKKAIRENGSAAFVNFGPGPFPLERSILSKISQDEREKLSIIALDVSPDILRYGLENGFIDQGIVTDILKRDSNYYRSLIPHANVIVFAEILEHIDHAAEFFADNITPWLRELNSFLIGSVPNAVQLTEYLPMIMGTGSPHQLSRPIFDSSNDHHSFFTVDILLNMLKKICGFGNVEIVSNAVRIEKDGNTAHLYAGLDFPALGDRLIFWANN